MHSVFCLLCAVLAGRRKGEGRFVAKASNIWLTSRVRVAEFELLDEQQVAKAVKGQNWIRHFYWTWI